MASATSITDTVSPYSWRVWLALERSSSLRAEGALVPGGDYAASPSSSRSIRATRCPRSSTTASCSGSRPRSSNTSTSASPRDRSSIRATRRSRARVRRLVREIRGVPRRRGHRPDHRRVLLARAASAPDLERVEKVARARARRSSRYFEKELKGDVPGGRRRCRAGGPRALPRHRLREAHHRSQARVEAGRARARGDRGLGSSASRRCRTSTRPFRRTGAEVPGPAPPTAPRGAARSRSRTARSRRRRSCRWAPTAR